MIPVRANEREGHLPFLLFVRELQRCGKGERRPHHILGIRDGEVHRGARITRRVVLFIALEVAKRPRGLFARHPLLAEHPLDVPVRDILVDGALDSDPHHATLVKVRGTVRGPQADAILGDAPVPAVRRNVERIPRVVLGGRRAKGGGDKEGDGADHLVGVGGGAEVSLVNNCTALGFFYYLLRYAYLFIILISFFFISRD